MPQGDDLHWFRFLRPLGFVSRTAAIGFDKFIYIVAETLHLIDRKDVVVKIEKAARRHSSE